MTVYPDARRPDVVRSASGHPTGCVAHALPTFVIYGVANLVPTPHPLRRQDATPPTLVSDQVPLVADDPHGPWTIRPRTYLSFEDAAWERDRMAAEWPEATFGVVVLSGTVTP